MQPQRKEQGREPRPATKTIHEKIKDLEQKIKALERIVAARQRLIDQFLDGANSPN